MALSLFFVGAIKFLKKFFQFLFVDEGAFSDDFNKNIEMGETFLILDLPQLFLTLLYEIQEKNHPILFSDEFHDLLLPEGPFFRFLQSLVDEV